jgi:dihydrofolate reductase
MKGSVFCATSLDGFIARPNGDVNWLPSASPGEDFGYEEFMSTVDALVMGRNSYDVVRSFSEWPYKDKPVIVLSRQDLVIPEDLRSCVEVIKNKVEDLLPLFAERGWKHIYVDGGKVIQSFLNAGLIQDVIIARIPILLGEGIPLFGAIKHDIHLDHIKTKIYDNGIVQNHYEVAEAFA